MPKVSMIVPVYNVESYLHQCVDSLLGQTFADFEILLVNDESTDGSLAIAHAYAENDARVRVIDKPHGGLGDTRNVGISQATGEYLAFVDSDDWVEPNMLEVVYPAAKEQNADLVVFQYIRNSPEIGVSRLCPLPHENTEADTKQAIFRSMLGPDVPDSPWRSAEMIGCAWRRLYRREWFLAHQLHYYNEQEIMLEDLPVSIMAHQLAERIVVLPDALYHYRYNPISLSTRYRPGKMEMLTRCYQLIEEFLTEQGLAEEYHERHLAWLLRNAAHSALINCFSKHHQVGFFNRLREIRAILGIPLLQQAARSSYFDQGTRGDRAVRAVIRSGNSFLVYLFYRIYAGHLFRNAQKKA